MLSSSAEGKVICCLYIYIYLIQIRTIGNELLLSNFKLIPLTTSFKDCNLDANFHKAEMVKAKIDSNLPFTLLTVDHNCF